MTLRPVTKSRRRQWRRASLHREKKWTSNWDWKDLSNKWHSFNPADHKIAIAGVLLMFLSIGFYSWAEQPGNSLFHHITTCPPDYAKPGAPCQDPSQIIWQDTTNTLNNFNTFGAVSAASCAHLAGTTCISMGVNSQANVALTKSTIGDLSVASKSLLAFHMSWDLTVLTLTANKGWGYYLTTNGTITSSTTYDPFNDKSVVFYNRFSCVLNCVSSTPSISIISFYLRTLGQTQTVNGEDAGGCSQSGSTFLCNTLVDPANNEAFDTANYLNYTGVVNPSSCTVSGNPGVIGPAPGCSWLLNQPFTGNAQSQYWQSTPTLPWFALQSQQYYLGFFLDGNAGSGVEWTFNTGTNGNADIFTFTPQTTGPQIDTGGFFGPVIKALINIGVFILNALLGFVSFIAPAVQTAINFLESLITNILNLIGNTLGFGNIGTDLSTFLSQLVTFFTNNSYGLPAYFANFAAYFTNFLRYLQIALQPIAPTFTIANAILTFGVNGIVEAVSIMTIGLQMLLFGYGTFMVFAYFLYTGDDGIGGLFTFLGTLEAISFDLLNLIAITLNLGIDFIVFMVSLIPKPFIQENVGGVPRLITIDTTASITFPKLDFGEARNGNLIVYWLWSMGIWFMLWFESQNPSLPGSLGALDPAIAGNVRILSTFIPLMQSVTLITGGLVLIWFCMLPLRLAGIDVTQSPLGASLGRLSGPGPSGLHVQQGKKHLLGRVKKGQEKKKEEKEAKAKTEEKVKGDIEKRKKEIEKEKRSEELRKKELAKKPTGKDLRGPNLQ